MLHTPGIFKFFWPKDNVETKYNQIYDIPIMNINKKLIQLDQERYQNFIVVHTNDIKSNI